MNSYNSIGNFGSNAYSPSNNPLTYCINDTIDQRFLHGGNSSIYGQNSRPCQLFLSDYCSEQWDGFCELASKNTGVSYPNQVQQYGTFSDVASIGLTAGEILIKNTAAKKYLVLMGNGVKKFEPFDPTVPTSPMISYWVPERCAGSGGLVPIYSVDPTKIDSDIVMDKILAKPIIAINILINIFNTMKREGTLSGLKGTKLGNFYQNNKYFQDKGGL